MWQKGRINITTKSILLIIIILIKWNMVHKAAQQINIIFNSTQSQLIYKNDKQTCKSNVFFFCY